MKLGFSSYCFKSLLEAGSMSVDQVLDWVGTSGADHLEVASFTFSPPGAEDDWSIDDDPELVQTLISASARNGIELSGLCIAANFIAESPDALRSQIDRVKHHVELADRMGIRYLRHDVTAWSRRDRDAAEFESCFPAFVEASKEIAQHAATYGITTSVENHGFFVNAGDRVRRLVQAVGEPNFATTIDIGNFLCVDEDPLSATRQNLPLASFVHVKDFYVRPQGFVFAPGWLETLGGNYLLGSILGYGDMAIPELVRAVVDSGYDGFVSIEFEGLEDPLLAATTGLANLRRMVAGFPQAA